MGYFHPLAVVLGAAVNTGGQSVCWESLLSVLLRMYLEVKFLEHAVNSVFHSPGNQNCFPQTRLLTPFHTPTSHAQGFRAPTSRAQGFRAPTSRAQGFCAPTSRSQGFRAPTSWTQGFRAPTSRAQGFCVPTSWTQGFRFLHVLASTC